MLSLLIRDCQLWALNWIETRIQCMDCLAKLESYKNNLEFSCCPCSIPLSKNNSKQMVHIDVLSYDLLPSSSLPLALPPACDCCVWFVGAFGFQPTPAPEGENIITTTRSHPTKVVQEAIEACEPSEVLRVGGAGHKVSYSMYMCTILFQGFVMTSGCFVSPGRVIS